jgi:hypothetical protein
MISPPPKFPMKARAGVIVVVINKKLVRWFVQSNCFVCKESKTKLETELT